MSPLLRYLLSGSRDAVVESPGGVETRLRSLEVRINVLIGLTVLNLLYPLFGLVWSSVKWLLILGPIIVLCIGLALFRHRLPEAGRRAWDAISSRRTVTEDAEVASTSTARTPG